MRSILTILGIGAAAGLMAWGARATPAPAGAAEAAVAMAAACSAPRDAGRHH
ncbi:MAG TPA: hypothetical protein VLI72_03000 [Methylibium sp.]|nr:hypothetical protein [Methylibium sp.]